MKRFGITPMTVRTVSFSRSWRAEHVRIAAELTLPEAVAEHHHRLRARPASLAVGVRPMSGGTPITSNVLNVPWLPRSRCGSPSPVHSTSLIVEAMTPSKIVLRSAISRN